jgi:hypothetical protein
VERERKREREMGQKRWGKEGENECVINNQNVQISTKHFTTISLLLQLLFKVFLEEVFLQQTRTSSLFFYHLYLLYINHLLKLLPGLSEKNSISRAKLKILSEVTSVL